MVAMVDAPAAKRAALPQPGTVNRDLEHSEQYQDGDNRNCRSADARSYGQE
jgi:hypothetical protein